MRRGLAIRFQEGAHSQRMMDRERSPCDSNIHLPLMHNAAKQGEAEYPLCMSTDTGAVD